MSAVNDPSYINSLGQQTSFSEYVNQAGLKNLGFDIPDNTLDSSAVHSALINSLPQNVDVTYDGEVFTHENATDGHYYTVDGTTYTPTDASTFPPGIGDLTTISNGSLHVIYTQQPAIDRDAIVSAFLAQYAQNHTNTITDLDDFKSQFVDFANAQIVVQANANYPTDTNLFVDTHQTPAGFIAIHVNSVAAPAAANLIALNDASTFVPPTAFLNALRNALPASVAVNYTAQQVVSGVQFPLVYNVKFSSAQSDGTVSGTDIYVNPEKLISDFFSQYDKDNPFPSDFATGQAFIAFANQKIRSVADAQAAAAPQIMPNIDHTTFNSVSNPPTISSTALISALTTDLFGPNGPVAAQLANQTVWPGEFTAGPSNATTIDYLNSVLGNFIYPSDGSGVTVLNFAQQVMSPVATTATIASSTGSPADLLFIPSYKNVYLALFPNATDEEFNAALQSFYNSQVTLYGVNITPSQVFGNWVSSIKQQYSSSLPTDFTTLHSIGAQKTIIISQIYALIASIISSIQLVTAAQSQRLVLLTQWQEAYSNRLRELPVFLRNNVVLGRKITEDVLDDDLMSKLNSQTNTKLNSSMQTQQSLVGDDAKALQSNINQSNDAVSQQANMANALIQQLNTLLAAIFK